MSHMKSVVKFAKSLVYRAIVKSKERKWKGKLNYLYYNHHSETLLIIFSGFTIGCGRKYSYLKNMALPDIDRLYILDPFGYQGSYNLYENGSNYPEQLTEELIRHIISQGGYKHVYTAGSSKGGTCALYFGLPIHADAILTGACQYNLGSFLHRPDHDEIFRGMMGANAAEAECEFLNSVMPKRLEHYCNSKTVVHVLYSKKEKTYERQIVDLLAKLRECNITTIEQEEFFDRHECVGPPFLAYMRKYFLQINR